MLHRVVSAAAFIVTLSMCVAASAAGPVDLWLDVPYVPQPKDGCGAASIAMVMQYWEREQGQAVQPDAELAQISPAVYSAPARGVYASAMVRYFQQHGFRAFAFAGNLADIQQQLAKGRPLIAALKPDTGSSLHYVVIVGLRQPQQIVLVNDPAQRKLLKMDQSQLEREWNAAGRWILLAVPEPSER